MSESIPLQSVTIGALAAALAAAQRKMGEAERDSENPFFGSAYADLASVWRACRDPLTENGLSVIQTTEVVDGVLMLRNTLAHSSGEWRAGLYPIVPMRQTKEEGWVLSDDPQSRGSAFRYARRYCLEGIAGVAPAGVDDDAETAMRRSSAAEPRPTAERPQRAITMPFGSGQGKAPEALTDKEVGWYIQVYERDIANPEKTKYLDRNRAVFAALTAESERRTSLAQAEPQRHIDAETGEIFDRAVPPGEPSTEERAGAEDDIAERAALIKSIKALSTQVKLAKVDHDAAAQTYLGGGTLATADLAGLAGLRDWLQARSGTKK